MVNLCYEECNNYIVICVCQSTKPTVMFLIKKITCTEILFVSNLQSLSAKYETGIKKGKSNATKIL